MPTHPPAPLIRRALLSDLDDVVSILDEAAGWLRGRQIAQWPKRFDPAWLTADIEAGHTWLVLAPASNTARTGPVATVTVTPTDPVWEDDEGGVASYVHRLARRRESSVTGAMVLDWVADQAHDAGIELVRLDCVAANRELRAYYEARGFQHRGDALVGGAPGQRDGPSTTTVTRYERTVGTPEPRQPAFDRPTPRPELDRVMDIAWPAATVAESDGWLFRATSGVTRRANSALAMGMPANLASTVADLAAFARREGIEPRILVSDASTPPALTRELHRLDYEGRAPTWVLVGTADTVLGRLDSAGVDPRLDATVTSKPTAEWFAVYWAVESDRHGPPAQAVITEQLLRPTVPTSFVVVSVDGVPASVGQVVVDGSIGCLQCLATAPDHRGLGGARSVFARLAAEAIRLGADDVFAAVMADNLASLRLCARAGLQPSHRYRYFEAA